MAKDYMCKNDKFYNNGWCNKRRIQGLKNVVEYEFKSECLGLKEVKKTSKLTQDKEAINTGSYKVFGARELSYHIQRQMLAIEGDKAEVDKYKALKEIMLGFEQRLVIDESIRGITTDYEINEDIVQASKNISKYWMENK